MQATLYNLTQPTNLIDKSLGAAVGTISVTPKEPGPFSLTDPVFIVDKATAPINANYCYIPEFNRYYFITSIVYDRAKRATFACHVDVLKTYQSRIEGTTLNYIRGSENVNEVDDEYFPIGDYLTTEWFDMPDWTNGFQNSKSGKKFILRVASSGVRTYTTVSVSVGDYVVYSKWKYQVVGPASAATLDYQGETTDTSLPRILNNNILQIDGVDYKVKVIQDQPGSVPYIGLNKISGQ